MHHRVSLFATLALVLAAPATRGDGAIYAPPEVVLASCTDVPTRPGELKLRCATFNLTASIEQAEAIRDAILETAIRALAADRRFRADRVDVTLGRTVYRGMRLITLGDDGKPVRAGLGR